jgi:hypothetical protein
MKTLDDLTPEIIAKIDVYKDKCTKDLYSGVEAANFNPKISTEYVEKVYEIAEHKPPVVIFAENPIEYKKKFQALQNTDIQNVVAKAFELRKSVDEYDNDEYQKSLAEVNTAIDSYEPTYTDDKLEIKSSYLYLCSPYHRVYLTWYKFIQDEFKIDHDNKETLNYLYERANNNISRCYFTEAYVLVLKMPHRMYRNEIGFHNAHGSAINWGDAYELHYINGRKIPSDIYNKVADKKLSFEEFIAIENEDIKAGIITLIKERFGDEQLMNFLGAEVVDTAELKHTSGHREKVRLWKTKKTFEFLADINGKLNQPYAWLEETCPSTGSVYLIDTSAHFTSALDASKFHRPQLIPEELRYDFTQFNN